MNKYKYVKIRFNFQALNKGLKTAVDNRVQAAKAASFARVKTLAESELKEFENMLQKIVVLSHKNVLSAKMAGD